MEAPEIEKEDRKSAIIPELLKSEIRGNVIQAITILLQKITLSTQQEEVRKIY